MVRETIRRALRLQVVTVAGHLLDDMRVVLRPIDPDAFLSFGALRLPEREPESISLIFHAYDIDALLAALPNCHFEIDDIVTGIEKVVVLQDDKAAERTVTTGRRGVDWIEITSGLKSGEAVVLDPAGIRTGQPLTLDAKAR